MGGEKLPLRNAAVPVGTFPSDSVIIPALNLAEILFSVGWFALVLLLTIEKQQRLQK